MHFAIWLADVGESSIVSNISTNSGEALVSSGVFDIWVLVLLAINREVQPGMSLLMTLLVLQRVSEKTIPY